jgi:hypothetical protein
MDTQNDPLMALVSSDSKAADRKKLADLVLPFLVIDHESKEFGFNSSFDELNGNELKLELLLAGAKARSLLFSVPDGLTPSEIISTGVMPEGSVKSSLKRLFDARKIRRDSDGRYVLPAHRIGELSNRVSA